MIVVNESDKNQFEQANIILHEFQPIDCSLLQVAFFLLKRRQVL